MQRCWMLWKVDNESVRSLLALLDFNITFCPGCPFRQSGHNCWDRGDCQAWHCQRYLSCDSCPIYEAHRREASLARNTLSGNDMHPPQR